MAKQPNAMLIKQIVAVIADHPNGVNPAGIARALRVSRSTITRTLAQLDHLGIYLSEDEKGRLFLF